ncbi:amidohydrolase family protein [Liquorilactobacillus mali]|uniref:Amidohydrolase n=1 Tax=Liquorilactobacillus mali TaxID=1618 RepID=A0A0R2FKG8_9LACO|nr:amidohydrolase [Liquorilactobacillus mali]KRN29080.1 amidohydrolase [Liquorilactobacillus mali]
MNKILLPKYIYFNEKFEQDYGIAVKENQIVAVAPANEVVSKFPDFIQKEYHDTVFVPGTVNTHNHSFQSLLRGIAIDQPFLKWRDNSLYKYSPKMRLEDIYNGALFAYAEMMKCGVTSVCDFFYLHNYGTESDEAVIQAAKDVGIRLVLARTMYDWDGAPTGYLETIDEAVNNTRQLALKYENNSMVTVIPAPHSLHGASPKMIQAGHKLALEMGTKFHMHVAEETFEVDATLEKHDKRTVEFLDELGVVDSSLVITHGVWLEDNEVKLLGDNHASLNYCPSSNMFLADGITNISRMVNNDINISLGSDGACGNNRISVFEEMRMTALLQKAITRDALCVKCKQAFDMGTKNGGKQLDLNVGEIKEGQLADFVGIDLNNFSMNPLSDNLEQMLPNIVYSLQPDAISTVIIDGETTVEDGELVKVSEAAVLSKVKDTMKYFETIN